MKRFSRLGKGFRKIGTKLSRKHHRSSKKVNTLDLLHACQKFSYITKFSYVYAGEFTIPNGRRLDFMAIPVSESKPIIGIEIKSSRSDFKADTKWLDYIDYCNLFFFVSPCKVVKPEDLPEDIGLIWVWESGVVRSVKQAKYRRIDSQHERDVYRRAMVMLVYGRARCSKVCTKIDMDSEDITDAIEIC